MITLGVVFSFALNLFDPITRATRGLINETLVANVIMIAVMVGVVLLGVGKLRPRDLGLIPSRLPVAAGMVALLWALTQAIEGIVSIVTTGGLQFDAMWTRPGVTVVIGLLLAQLLGNTVYEEIAFRGFLLIQVLEKLRKGRAPRVALALALGISQGLFALKHIPIRIYSGTPPLDILTSLPVVFLLGLLFSMIYLRTGNLFFAMGVHSLGNQPTSLFAYSSSGSTLIIYSLALGAAVLWPIFSARLKRPYPAASAA